MKKLFFIEKAKYIDIESGKEKTGCIYLYFFGKLFILDIRKNRDNIIDELQSKRTRKIELSKLEKIARKNKSLLSFAVSPLFDEVTVSIEKKGSFFPIVDICITDGTYSTNNRIMKEQRMTMKELNEHYVRKEFLSSAKNSQLFAKREDLSNFNENPEVHIFSRIREDVFAEVWGKYKDAEKIIKELEKTIVE